MKSTCTWVNGHQSVINNGRNHSVVIDLPEKSNGKDLGATALELANMSLNGCIVTIFSMIASKMRLSFEQLEVELDAKKGPEDATVSGVFFEFRIKTEESAERVEKCLNQTLKTCPVGVIYEKAGIETEYRIVML